MPGREKLTGTILVVDDNAANRDLLQAQETVKPAEVF